MAPHHRDIQEMLTARECAARLGITVDYLNHLARTGKVRRHKLGHRTYRYIWPEVLDDLQGIRSPVSSAPPRSSTPPSSSAMRIASDLAREARR